MSDSLRCVVHAFIKCQEFVCHDHSNILLFECITSVCVCVCMYNDVACTAGGSCAASLRWCTAVWARSAPLWVKPTFFHVGEDQYQLRQLISLHVAAMAENRLRNEVDVTTRLACRNPLLKRAHRCGKQLNIRKEKNMTRCCHVPTPR